MTDGKTRATGAAAMPLPAGQVRLSADAPTCRLGGSGNAATPFFGTMR